MAVNWAELSSLLACAVPEVNVNILYDEMNPETTKAIELRPRPRMFDALPALPPKWTVIIFVMQTGRICVAIFKMDREVLKQSEFDPSQAMEIVDFIKSHPFLNSKWSVCQGLRNKVMLEISGPEDTCGKTMKLSGRCELLISGEQTIDPSTECKFCSVKGVLDGNEEQVKVEVKEELEVCPEVYAYSDMEYTEDLEYPKTARRAKKQTKRQKGTDFDICIKEDPEKSLTGFICKFCDESFECNKMLMSHTLSEHRNKPGLKFLSFYMDKVSLDGNSGQVMQCHPCDKVFVTVGPWVKHMQRHKGLAGVFVPNLQEYKGVYKEYTNEQGRSYHHKVGKHKLGRFICHLCGAEMVPSARHYHLRNVHKLGEEHRCEVCGYLTHDKNNLQKHMNVHNAERPFVCPHCGRTFRHKESLNICLRRCTGQGLFECSVCSRQFTQKERLKHHELLHKGIRPHECPLCHLTYTRRSNMVDHVKRVHKKRLADVVAEMQLQTKQKEEREQAQDAEQQEN